MYLPRFILEPLIRRKAQLHRTPVDRYEVRVARTTEEYRQAFFLVHCAYVSQGIEPLSESDLRMTPHHLLSESTVLVAYEGNTLVGTMTVVADSAAQMPLDGEYPQQIQQLRDSGSRLVEFGALAVTRPHWGTGVTALLSLASVRIAREAWGADHAIIGCHPRAVPLHRALYGYSNLGPVRTHSLLEAPVAGLLLDLNAWPEFAARHYPEAMASGHTLAEHSRGTPLSCIELPPEMSLEELTRWKMPRQVFRELMQDRPDLLDTLSTSVRTRLQQQRSRQTVRLDLPGSRRIRLVDAEQSTSWTVSGRRDTNNEVMNAS